MAQLTVEAVSLTGATPAMVAASTGGDSFSNSGKEMLKVTNGGSSSVTVTVASPQPCNYGYNHDVVVDVTAGATQDIGPFPPARFNSKGNVQVTYSGVNLVTVAAVRV